MLCLFFTIQPTQPTNQNIAGLLDPLKRLLFAHRRQLYLHIRLTLLRSAALEQRLDAADFEANHTRSRLDTFFAFLLIVVRSEKTSHLQF